MGGVVVVLDSPRRLTVSVEPALVVLGEAVEITVTLTEPSPDDQPQVRVAFGSTGAPLDLRPDQVAPGVWTASFTPDQAGSYSVTALVEGPKPRFNTAWVQVEAEGPAPGDGPPPGG